MNRRSLPIIWLYKYYCALPSKVISQAFVIYFRYKEGHVKCKDCSAYVFMSTVINIISSVTIIDIYYVHRDCKHFNNSLMASTSRLK